MKTKHIPLKLFLKLLAALVSASFCLQASAATITVINTSDSGAGSLRQAISDSSSGDTIDFDSSLNGQTITLTSGELLIDKSLTITGPGANLLAINGNAAGRVFDITSNVTISGLTITNGSFAGCCPGGGGIHNNGTLTITNCTVSGNSATYGGGIFNDFFFGTVTIANSTLSGNSADQHGGGIWNGNTLTITNCTLSGNSAGGIGGAMYSGGNTLTITNSTLSGNSAYGDGGGGIYDEGPVIITNSTLSGNSAHSGGGGINNHGGPVTITNSTLSGNSATADGGGIWNGAGFGGPVRITNSTLSGNSATNDGGGIWNYFNATTEIGNTILNTGVSGANIFNLFNSGTVTSLGYNLSNDAAGGDGTTGPGGLLNATGDQRNTDPLLGPLQDNGGPTFTHALLIGSPAIDAGDPNFDPNSFTPPLTTDQRGSGFARVANTRIDIGAFEVQLPNTPAGSNVMVNIGTVGSTIIALRFPQVTVAGTTTVTPIDPSSAGYTLPGSSLGFDITTTAAYPTPVPTPPGIVIAFQVAPPLDASQLTVFHDESGNLVNVTCPSPRPGPTPDTTTNTIYASVTSLSPFVVAKVPFTAHVQQPINSDGSSVFKANRGVVPVKFTLTHDGNGTCTLPTATIALTRTAGGPIGAIDESVYSGAADTGSNFRISSCQYVYNLNSGALGVGTYRVDIKISGIVVGSATFGLK